MESERKGRKHGVNPQEEEDGDADAVADIGNPYLEKPRPGKEWMATHKKFLAKNAELGSKIRIVFIGSSSTYRWQTTGKEIWEEKYVPLGAVNYGIGSDKMTHVLWRIGHGELDNISPHLIVIFIAPNIFPPNSNLTPSDKMNSVIQTTAAVIQRVREKQPSSKILYVNNYPRKNAKDKESGWRETLEISGKVRAMDFGENVHFHELFWEAAETWGEFKPVYAPDNLHFNKKGYTNWDASWNTTFFKLLNEPLVNVPPDDTPEREIGKADKEKKFKLVKKKKAAKKSKKKKSQTTTTKEETPEKSIA